MMYSSGYNYYPTFRQRVTTQQAQEIALSNVPGQVIHVDMELENGILVYEVFILTPQNKMFEVEVAANTGAIIKVEEENDFD